MIRRSHAVTEQRHGLTLLYDKANPAASLNMNTTADDFGRTLTAIDLSTGRYVFEMENAAWTAGGISGFAGIGVSSANGAAGISFRVESGWLVAYERDNNNARDFKDVALSASYGLQPSADARYQISLEAGMGQCQFRYGREWAISQSTYGTGNVMEYKATTVSRPDPAGICCMTRDAAVSMSRIRVWQRRSELIRNVVLIGDSITSAPVNVIAMRQGLGEYAMVHARGMGYSQSREMATRVATAYGGDAFNAARYHPDVAGNYYSGARSNWVVISIGTNDLINITSSIVNPGPLCGGYTATGTGDGVTPNTDTINNILAAIAAIKANNAGWKVAVRTVLNTAGMSGGGSYATCEAARQSINTSITSGAIRSACDVAIDLENLFCPSGSRTDGGENGAIYDASYWPPSAVGTAYSKKAANFDGAFIHPLTATYKQIASYVVSKIPQ